MTIKADKEYMGRVAALGCAICRLAYGIEDTPALVHHLRTGQGKKRASDKHTMPLCPTHHASSGQGVHDMGRDEFKELHNGIGELECLADTITTLQGITCTPEQLLSELTQAYRVPSY